MKILSYNVNGLRALEKNGKLAQLRADFSDFDVMCFQEIKMNDYAEVARILQTTQFNVSMSKKRGYAGVLTTSDKSSYYPLIEYCDDVTYTSGRIICTCFHNFYLINVYVPNSGNKDALRQYWDEQFREWIKLLDKPVVICGDFNVCATNLDYWGNYNGAKDSCPGLMQFEIDAFDKLCKECDLVDAYRYVHSTDRKYSWFSMRNKSAIDKNQGWRLDYFLVSNSIKDKIRVCDIIQGYQAPDHSPIVLEIDLN